MNVKISKCVRFCFNYLLPSVPFLNIPEQMYDYFCIDPFSHEHASTYILSECAPLYCLINATYPRFQDGSAYRHTQRLHGRLKHQTVQTPNAGHIQECVMRKIPKHKRSRCPTTQNTSSGSGYMSTQKNGSRALSEKNARLRWFCFPR